MFPIACAGAASTRSLRNPIRPLWCGRNWSSFSEMKCISIRFLLVLAMSMGAYAQSAPQVQAILDRLDQLEKDNQALLEEVRALRQEVSVLHAPATSQTADERQAVDENRVDEMAQTKVEASQKFPIRITGMALFNASVNGRFNGNMENPLVASSTPGEMTGDGTLRQSILGLLFNGPGTFLNAKISG